MRTNRPKHHHPRRKRTERNPYPPKKMDPVNREFSETESSYLKSLIDSRSKVTVFMKNGESFTGRIRYYDRDCFSVGLSKEKRKIFLRKEHVCYISEK